MTNNDKIRELLKDRESYFESIRNEDLLYFDDEQLKNYQRFLYQYNKLTQLEKDVWFLSTQMRKTKIADLYEVSKSYITQITKSINEKLK